MTQHALAVTYSGWHGRSVYSVHLLRYIEGIRCWQSSVTGEAVLVQGLLPFQPVIEGVVIPC